MKTAFTSAFAVAILYSTSGISKEVTNISQLFGTWSVVKMKASIEVHLSWNDDDSRFMGRKLEINPDSARWLTNEKTFEDLSCVNPSIDKDHVLVCDQINGRPPLWEGDRTPVLILNNGNIIMYYWGDGVELTFKRISK